MIVEKKISELRSSANQNADNTYFSTDRLQEGMWRIDPADTTSADNTGTVLVNTSGQRFKRIVDSVVNVQWFGANGLGTQDDYTALQNAINAASAVYIPAGNYIISKPLRIQSGKTIIGENNQKSMITKTTNNTLGGSVPDLDVDAIMVIDPAGTGYAVGVKIQDLKLLTTAALPCEYGIYFPRTQFTHLENVEVWKCKYGIFTQNTFQSRFIAILCTHVDYGFTWQPVSETSISGTSCTFERCWALEVKRRGYNLTGLQYSNLLNCAADHLGEDESDTGESSSYYFERCIGIALSACGTEDLKGRVLAIINSRRITCESMNAGMSTHGKTFADTDMAMLTIKNSRSVTIIASEFYATDPTGTLKDYYIDNSSVQLHTTTYTSYASRGGNYINNSIVTDYGFNTEGQLQSFANKVYRMDKTVVTRRVELNETNFWLPEKFIHLPDNAVLKEIRVYIKQSLNKTGHFDIKYYGSSQGDYYFRTADKVWIADDFVKVNPVLSRSVKPAGLTGDWAIHAEPQPGYTFYGGLVLIVEADYFLNSY
ncbi:glycosyl hydrolase family 28-related protein [Chitinophaga sp.]|uniref:glycosyl hydrolase family 28-related protein n=1 Tax=Chitinophaga sp. TaxID=1869181 RepID=UPI002F92DD64